MTRFSFLHAADLHLDSPLLGLAAKSQDHARRVEEASRQAFRNLIDLALQEECRFVLLAGDLFDGQLRNFQTGLFFLAQMKRLEAAGVRAFVVLGNHDAENAFASRLAWSGNVHLFDHRKAQTQVIEDLGVAVHGRSFGRRDITENLARDYPAPQPGLFNIGLLHTACQGHEGEHAAYAPCTLEQLVNHGYDYWALGHVHAHAVLSKRPHVVYPGNLQGRHPRETGPKGAVLVRMSDGEVQSLEHRPLDVVRWAAVSVDVGRCGSREAVLEAAAETLRPVLDTSGERLLALRITLVGESGAHADLTLNLRQAREDIEALLATLPGEAWLESLQVRTRAPPPPDEADPTIAGRIAAELAAMAEDPDLIASLEAHLKLLRSKLPAGARPDDLLGRLRTEGPLRAAELALSLVLESERTDAAS